MQDESSKPNTLIVVTVKTKEGVLKRNLDYMKIHHINDTYYQTELHVDDGEVVVIQETYPKLRKLIQASEKQR